MNKKILLFSSLILGGLFVQSSAQAGVVASVKDNTQNNIKLYGEQSMESFIEEVGPVAQKIAHENDLFASVMLAQALLESGSGNSLLSQSPYNNLFGVKGEYQGQSQVFGTLEENAEGETYFIDSAFRQYPSIKESLEDYARLMRQGLAGAPDFYQGTWKSEAEHYDSATQALTGTYATDHLYDSKLNNIIETYNLTRFDKEVKQHNVTPTEDLVPYDGVNYDVGNSYAFGNCTQYVYNRITQLGGYIDLDMGNAGFWGSTAQERGYHVSNMPEVGAALVFEPGVLGADPTYGHIAFVEAINQDGSLEISEMNVEGLGVVSSRTIESAYTSSLTYIRAK